LHPTILDSIHIAIIFTGISLIRSWLWRLFLGDTMTDKKMFEEAFPQSKQIGGNHYKSFHIQPYEFISKNNLSFFQGNVVKYVCRYLNKNGIEDLEKIIHYCQLEIKKLKDLKK
jgi:hypothetical protein